MWPGVRAMPQRKFRISFVGGVMADNDDKYWYNLKTGQVERGMQAPAPDRAGPFDTAEEAARAPEIIRERSRQWDEDERRDDSWGSSETGFEG